MVKKVFSILAWVVTAGALVALFIIARNQYLDTPIRSVNVDIERDASNGFVKEDAVVKEMNKLCETAKIGTVNMATINNQLKSNPWIESSSSFIDLGANLNINIKEYQPIIRIFGKNGTSAYITAENVMLPTSQVHTPHVLIASGNFSLDAKQLNRQLNDTLESDQNIIKALHILNAVQRNDFMNACVGQLYCNSKNEFELVATDIDARICVGDTCNIDDKLKRLEIFIKQKINSIELKELKKIDLQYKNQIVCTKR